MDLTIEPMHPGDWDAMRVIYQEGIDTGHATLEVTAPEWEKWDTAHLEICRLVAKRDGQVLGWAALTPVSSRAVYAGVAEVSVYIGAAARGQGVGKALLNALIAESERCGLWTLQGHILAENSPSLALVAACGFRTVGCREKLGQLNGVWKDTILVERRSSIVGI
ncbi:MAG TPA: GNAT family N-acetyltransferase [Aggregatilineaceae bacterium]|nr:GNAT family N-acetyltransferase [Aggregatilineaceae bacterium]